MTEGQRLLALCGEQQKIAWRCGVSQPSVCKWLRVGPGGTKPGYAAREVMSRPPPEGYGIPMKAWDEPVSLPPAASATLTVTACGPGATSTFTAGGFTLSATGSKPG